MRSHSTATNGRPIASGSTDCASGWPRRLSQEEASDVLHQLTTNRSYQYSREGRLATEALFVSSPILVLSAAENALIALIGQVWDRGWRPGEVIRQARRQSKTMADLVSWVVAADDQLREQSTLDPRWKSLIEAADLPAEARGGPGWLSVHGGHHRHGEPQAGDRADGGAGGLPSTVDVALLVGVMRFLYADLISINKLVPPPGGSWDDTDNPSVADMVDRSESADPLLIKIRSLLAQAESTEFPAEAETFTAKAQQLMTRHAIDGAILGANLGDAHRNASARPIFSRLGIDDPYADPKFSLLSAVCSANRCQAVWAPHYAMADIIGFREDAALAEVLFTSLLIQAQFALGEQARLAPPGSKPRSRGFRSSFLMAYAHGIAKRLAEANREAVDHAVANDGESFLPVLASRADSVEELVASHYPGLTKRRSRHAASAEGVRAGMAAAKNATIDRRDSQMAGGSAPDRGRLGS